MADLLRLPQVLLRVGLKTTRIYELVGDGDFPKPVRLGDRAVAWLSTEIDDWISAQAKKPRVEITTRSKKKAQTAEAA
jgi:prophage regulatory protein